MPELLLELDELLEDVLVLFLAAAALASAALRSAAARWRSSSSRWRCSASSCCLISSRWRRITATQYDELVTKDAKRLCEIDDELVQLEQDTGAAEITTSHLLDLASRASELFKSSKPAVKNQILRLLVSNLKIQQKRLQFNLLEPFAMLSNFNDCTTWLPGLDDFRIACYEYDRLYGRALAEFVSKNLQTMV